MSEEKYNNDISNHAFVLPFNSKLMLHSSSQNTLWTRVQFSNIYPLNLFAIWAISGILWLIFNLDGSDHNRLLNVYVIEYTNLYMDNNKLDSFLFMLKQNT